ncbi:threonine ammonia-lyase [Helicobacter muridarum]|uniref:Threonine ammonia-lyase n=1 Tax=Helicobacter muridarum TaxID=216 RepID=A0A099TXD4_9HELI|nr:threonine ammonia-lyase [Helicobacter muridarum]TLE01336.1 threonine ammonia-lyase [Helicobacter muridarum]STQ85255.1 threonine dehydratase [Helicobacter muridarum]
MQLIPLDYITKAAKRLEGIIAKHPLAYAPKLSKIANTEVFLKKENLQPTGAFKIRGAFNKLAVLKEKDLKNGTQVLSQGVICASAGNHAQGVAFSAQHFQTRAVIVMPEATPLLKIMGTRSMGAEVVLVGNNYDEAYSHAMNLAKEQNLTFIHPFADIEVIAGQGSIALEMIKEEPLDILIVPIGGGGLISGIASVYKALNPQTKIIGVNAKGANAMKNSFEAKKAHNSDSVRTIADGIAVRDVNESVFECILKGVDDIVEVDDDEIASAILFLLEFQKLVTEGAGAAGVAAILHNKLKLNTTQKVGVVISGGNIDITMLNVIIERALLKSSRKMKFQVILIDKPGSLQKLTELLTNQNANIVFINYSRISTKLQYGDAIVEIALEIKGEEHKESIFKTMMKHGYTVNEIL